MRSCSYKDIDQLLSYLMETILSSYIRQLMCFKGYHFTGSLRRKVLASDCYLIKQEHI